MVVDHRDATVDFIRLRGPSLPAQLAKHLNCNTLLSSAVLSDLADKGKVKISKLKFGGSPLYYVPGQEEQLLKFLDSLDEKDRRTVLLLQQRLVLRDVEQDPLVRVSLRQIKDFAVQLTVTSGSNTEIFWKYFLVNDDDVHKLIGKILAPQKKVADAVPSSAVVDAGVSVPAVAVKSRATRKKRVESPLSESGVSAGVMNAVSSPVVQSVNASRASSQSVLQSSSVSVVVPVVQNVEVKALPGRPAGPDEFFDSLMAYFSQNKIELVEHEVLKRNSEHDCVIRVPSPVGSLMYYCKAKRKQKVGDLDVGAAFAQGQLRKLPVLLLAPGEMTSKAVDLAQRLKCVTFAKVSC